MSLKALFFNHQQQNCGVHEYGRLLAEKLNASDTIDLKYLEISSENEFIQQADLNCDASVSFVNYHPETVPWLTKDLVQLVRHPVIGIMHEFGYLNAFYEGSQIFDFRALIDPSVRSRLPNVTVHPRVVVGCRPLTKPREQLTVGSFGFGTPSKCFDHVVELVKREFSEATIRFNIPAAAFGDPEGIEARKIAETCSQMVEGTRITLEVSHEFLTPEQLVDFLGENTINIFCYTDDRGRGISSAVDFAVASGRPFGVSDGTMFRHIRHRFPEVFISKHGIKGVLEYGTEPVNKLRELWSDTKLVKSFRDAAINAMDAFEAYVSRQKLFNIALDDVERSRYSNDVQEMKQKVPEMMSKKIAEANVQQAFIKSAVEHFSKGQQKLNILCVGSFEDTAYETLRAKGYSITAIDPEIDVDLSAFYQRKSTTKASFDIVFSTSVIEHVRDDEMFISQITDLLAVDGVAILTTDFFDGYAEGDVKPCTDYRLYTIKDLLLRLVPLMHCCSLVGPHFWQRSSPDFMFEGAKYSFASLVFRKYRELPDDAAFSQEMRTELQKRAVDKHSELPREKENMEREILALKRERLQWSAERTDTIRMGNSRLMRLLWKIRKKLSNAHSLSMKSASKRLHQLVGTRAKRVVKSGALSLLNMARESKVRLAKAIRSKTARHPKVKALLGKNSSPAPSISMVVLQLDHDYGTDIKEWLRYRKSLLKKTHLRKLGRCQREGKLWVCMSRYKTSERIDWKQLAATTSVLSQTQERPVELILHDDSDRHGTGQSPLPNVSIINDLGLLAEITADADSIIFIEVNDVVDKDSIRILEENNAFAADVVLFDFYYVDGPKAYPVTLHGVDPLHALHCDYFFSRFLVSSRLLKQVTRHAERGMSPRCVAVSCLSAADNCSTLHIAIPLLQAALDKPTIRIAKAKTEKHSRHTVDTTSQVSAVICTKDNHLLLRQLIWRLKGERAIKDIIVVSNNSSSQDMHALLSELSETGDAKVLIYNKPFNFSEQSNMGAMSGSSQSLLFINDDTTPVNDDWLELLLETSAWNGGSITGPLLVYPDQTVQHGGMFLGFNNTAGHCMRYSVLPDENSGFWLHAPRRVSSLTGAALLVPRAVFESLNGFDTMLGHYLQDVDFCMRASGMGVPVVFDPRSILIHFESLSVKRTLSDERVTYTREKEFEYFRRRWPILHDKWLNPRLSPDDEAMRSFVSL